MPDQVFVRYTGTVPGSRNYTAPGCSRKYAFGNNPSHIQQRMPESDYLALKRAHNKDLIAIPPDKSAMDLPLQERINQCAALAEPDRERLYITGILTVGQALAIGGAGLTRIFGSLERSEAIVGALWQYCFGDPLMPPAPKPAVREDLTVISRVGPSTQEALYGMGYLTVKDIAERLTLEEWLSLGGKNEAGYQSVVSSALSIAREGI